MQYADYTLWQLVVLGEESDPASAISHQLGYWRDALAGLPDQLDLPLDHARPAVSSHCGGSVGLRLPAALHEGLHRLARESGASLFMVLQAGLAGLLTRLGCGHDIAIGSPIAGRTDDALDDLIGFFVNTLVLRTDTSGHPSSRELIGRVRAVDLAAYEHQDVPFERLVEVLNPARSLSRHPLFQVMLALQNIAPVRPDLPGLAVSVEPVAVSAAKFDLSLSLAEQRLADGSPAGIDGALEYASDLFERGSIEALAGRLVRLLEGAVAEPDRPIGSLDVLGIEERAAILRGWNDSAQAIAPATLPQLFAAQAQKAPDAVAVVCGDDELSYRRARSARQSTGASSARARGRAGGGGRPVRRALARDGDRAARHPQGGRRLSAARSGLPGRAAHLHARGCAGARADARRRLAWPSRLPAGVRRLLLDQDALVDGPRSAPAVATCMPATCAYVIYHLGLHRQAEGVGQHPSWLAQSAASGCRAPTG